MNLQTHYDNLYHESIQKIKTDNYTVDNLMDAPDDYRRGVTLLLRPDASILQNIQHFADQLQAIEPNQYYHPSADLHVTAMAIITCCNGFELSSIHVPDYVKMIETCLPAAEEIQIRFRGVTVSPSCILIQGFMENNTLNAIRDRLRTNFKASTLQQSIDLRYAIQTAHTTIVRFRQPFSRKDDYLRLIEQYRHHDFGTLSTRSFELVFNDWYQRKEIVKKLHRFNIPTATHL